MLSAPETAKAATTPCVQVSETAAHGQGKSDSPASVVCDLADARAFCLGFGTPNVPVLAAFGLDRLHAYKLEGSWDLDKAASENADALFRSIRRFPSKDAPVEWDDLTSQFGPRSFLYVGRDQIASFASTPDEAER